MIYHISNIFYSQNIVILLVKQYLWSKAIQEIICSLFFTSMLYVVFLTPEMNNWCLCMWRHCTCLSTVMHKTICQLSDHGNAEHLHWLTLEPCVWASAYCTSVFYPLKALCWCVCVFWWGRLILEVTRNNQRNKNNTVSART